eukprot:CAMPEP_0206582010 /NCGR_PEP_ID=MMETSP0325_2-20121206/34209_1 /ASSEMBLY_ACC=CAM_ASM_000347 /TAXON_ID=2866 /ORGANISM="Crypthecodinium cohnii, Strain Seligo" /LENGTH=233 /DNA_ID=CAMNT_0054088569 /DNA_START=119 /DNA_END=817 /DNA_ORIENTATION=+
MATLVRALKLVPPAESLSFIFFAVLKSALAGAGLQTFFAGATGSGGWTSAIEVSRGRKWLWLYVAMQGIDTWQALRQRYGWSSLLHHFATGCGLAVDALFGSNRTITLAVASLSNEAVAPFYQAFGLLKAANLGETSAAKRCVQAVVAITVAVRLPVALSLGLVAAKDLAAFAARRRCQSESKQRGHRLKGEARVDEEVQPWLLVPSIGGIQLLLFLDYLWIRGWAMPKLRNW